MVDFFSFGLFFFTKAWPALIFNKITVVKCQKDRTRERKIFGKISTINRMAKHGRHLGIGCADLSPNLFFKTKKLETLW